MFLSVILRCLCELYDVSKVLCWSVNHVHKVGFTMCSRVWSVVDGFLISSDSLTKSLCLFHSGLV